MKKLLATVAACAVVASAAYADATVALNNFAANPIYLLSEGTLAGADVMVEFWGGPVGGDIAMISNTDGVSAWPVEYEGFFDGGVGVVPGVADSADAQLVMRAYQGETYDGAFGAAPTAEVMWTQATGAWNPNAVPPAPPTGPDLAYTDTPVLNVVPEPSTIALGLLGAAVLLLRRRK